jgi:hypothetical protein
MAINQAFTDDCYGRAMTEPMPIISDDEIIRSAIMMLKNHGGDAGAIATMHADIFLCFDNAEGYRLWKRIEMVVEEMLLKKSDSRANLH